MAVHLAPEWAEHQATWLCWPHCSDTWPGALPAAQNTMAMVVQQLTHSRHHARLPVERVEILLHDATMHAGVVALLTQKQVNLDHVGFHVVPHNDVWIRDFGPTFVFANSELAAVDWVFDTWGGKGPDYYGDTHGDDDAVAATIARQVKSSARRAPVIMEGGALDSNGEGVLLTTRNCLLHRKGQLSTTDENKQRLLYEQAFEQFLGVEKVIWLDGVDLPGDDTGGHVDNLARFVASDTIVMLHADVDHPLHEVLKQQWRSLEAATDAHGQYFKLIALPLPASQVWHGKLNGNHGQWILPASYANFYIANGCVLVPTFDDPKDAQALDILSACFPAREVVGIDCREFILGQGAIHCATQQQPRYGA